MTKHIPVDIFSGFLGAGKTTLIRKLLEEYYKGEKIFLLENEFGQAGIDGALLAGHNIEMKEIYSGCICCSLKGDFTKSLLDALEMVKPRQIIIEPTGVGKLSEILKILNQEVFKDKLTTGRVVTVVDAPKAISYLRNFGTFFKDQLSHAQTIVLSKTQNMPVEGVQNLVNELRKLNTGANWVTTPWDKLTGEQIMRVNPWVKETGRTGMFQDSRQTKGIGLITKGKMEALLALGTPNDNIKPTAGPGKAEDVFQVWSWESSRSFSDKALEFILVDLSDEKKYGQVVRAKGIIPGQENWLHFDYVSKDWDIGKGFPQPTGRMVVIGQNLNTNALQQLFEDGQQ